MMTYTNGVTNAHADFAAVLQAVLPGHVRAQVQGLQHGHHRGLHIGPERPVASAVLRLSGKDFTFFFYQLSLRPFQVGPRLTANQGWSLLSSG